jgi:hypothetical protein
MSHDPHRLLSELPTSQWVDIDGMAVRLQLEVGGAVLSAELPAALTIESTMRHLELGFSNALEFNAGLAIDPEGRRLMLTQWLAGITNWPDAESALESLLNQVDVCRTVCPPSVSVGVKQASRESLRQREERRLRAQLSR